VGVPETLPDELNERPVGNCPDDKVQEYGCVPPLAESVAPYAVPTTPFGKLLVVMAKVFFDATAMLSA
jgi:hypothetical protein